jgi:hypothetical protein
LAVASDFEPPGDKNVASVDRREHRGERGRTTNHWRMRARHGGLTVAALLHESSISDTCTARAAERFAALPGDDVLSATVVALEERGFGLRSAGDRDAARIPVLACVPEGLR